MARHVRGLTCVRRIADGGAAPGLREPEVSEAYLGQEAAEGPGVGLKTDLAPAWAGDTVWHSWRSAT